MRHRRIGRGGGRKILTFNGILSENVDGAYHFREAMERNLKNAIDGLINVKTAREALLKVAEVNNLVFLELELIVRLTQTFIY